MSQPMFVFHQYTNTSRANLSAMHKDQRIIYGLIMALRFSPFYDLFFKINSFGDPLCLSEIRDVATKRILDPLFDLERTHELLRKIDPLIPDSDRFADCADAMDAGLIHLYILEYLAEGDFERIVYISGIVYDLFDRKAQDALQTVGIESPSETQIGNHSIIKLNVEREYQIQRDILSITNSQTHLEMIVDKWNVEFIGIERNAEI